ncbi:MAG: ribose 5-phosphate isomerase B [Deltaproteobacteria bacterium]|nr:ribose 5-phosphate isomerase B [Deltaproteobacteria bacterium]HCH61387.1 ribose 5-phosphate isomerase B [Deltaproteobacteria bacterium]
MLVFVASDHAGHHLRQSLLAHLSARGVEWIDLGPAAPERCDYPDFAAKVAHRVARGEGVGLLVCGTGVGMSMSANKIPGIRAAVVSDVFSARATKQHNNANVLCLGERVVGTGLAAAIVDAWLDAEFEGGRHAGRVAKLHALETRSERS